MTIALLSLVKPNVSGNCRGYKPRQIVGAEPDYQENRADCVLIKGRHKVPNKAGERLEKK